MNGRPMSEKKEHWFNLANQTSLMVSEIFGNQQAAVLLAGAVFALHQDVKKALEVDLFAPDASSPDTGNRLSHAIEQLYGIMDETKATMKVLQQTPRKVP